MSAIANIQFFLGIVVLAGHIWHASLAKARWRAKPRTPQPIQAPVTAPVPET